MANECGNPYCRAYQLTVNEFERLGGEQWTQSFRIRLGQRAKKIYSEIYTTKKLRKERANTRAGYRNKVTKYPCGVLEQAYKALIAEGIAITNPGINKVQARREAMARRRAVATGSPSIPADVPQP